MTLYDDLGVSPDATAEQIIAAYRRKAKEHHPDAGGDPAEFAKAQRAAEILRDPEKRSRYDATGVADESPVNEQAEAAEVLCSVFRQVRQQFREHGHRIDLALQLKAGLTQLLDSLKRERERLEGEQRDNDDAKHRLRHRGENADFIHAMLEEESATIDRGLADVERKGRIFAAALELAKDYDWIVDLDPLDTGQLPNNFTFPAVGSR
jgi:curved DNA-binding protein CbpA